MYFFYVSIKIISYIVHARVHTVQLHNNLLLDFVYLKKKNASTIGYCFLFIMYGSNDHECYVSGIYMHRGLFFPGVSLMMMMMMMTGARVDLCNKSNLLRKRKTTDEMNVQKQK